MTGPWLRSKEVVTPELRRRYLAAAVLTCGIAKGMALQKRMLTCSSVIRQAPQQNLADKTVVVLSRVIFAACRSLPF